MAIAMRQQIIIEPPSDIGETLPSITQLVASLSDQVVAVEGDTPLYRAAYSPHGVVPDCVPRAYRFGPPARLIAADGTMRFWWLYVAFEPDTTVWEGRFCQNDQTRPGTFYIEPSAERDGIIATLRFPRAMRLWNLNSEASSKLGVYDNLSSPDYEWCQWFGARMHDAMVSIDGDARPDGIAYPSRRHRGRAAIILSSAAVESMKAGVRHEHVPFVDHPSYRRLLADPLRVSAPVLTVP